MSMKGVVYTRQEWEATKKHWKGECAYCGGNRTKKKNLTKDHVIPESMGGQKIRHNIIPACGCCNQEKSSEPMPEWFKQQEFFSEKRLQKIYWWIGGGCYTISLRKSRYVPPIENQGGQLIPKKIKPPKKSGDFTSLD